MSFAWDDEPVQGRAGELRMRRRRKFRTWARVVVFTVLASSICLIWRELLAPGVVALAVLGAYLLITGIWLARIGDLQGTSLSTKSASQLVGNQRILLAMLVLVAALVLSVVLAEQASV